MPLPSSGPLSLADIAAEFGDTAPHSLSEFYRGGGKVPNAAANGNVPTAGAIGMGGFYGAVNEIVQYVTSTQLNLNVGTLFGSIYTTDIPKRLIINPGVYVGSNSRTSPALTIPGGMAGALVIENFGYIHAAGGINSGESGGDAILAQSAVSILNGAGAEICGGGGAGGAGGAGGQGGQGYGDDGTCPPEYASIGLCAPVFRTYVGGAGGAGGPGGRGKGYDGASSLGAAGSGGLQGGPYAGAGGAGGTGGQGGEFGQAGYTGSPGQQGANGNNGTGFAGQPGQTGGAAGRYLVGSVLVSLTNNGVLAGGIS